MTLLGLIDRQGHVGQKTPHSETRAVLHADASFVADPRRCNTNTRVFNRLGLHHSLMGTTSIQTIPFIVTYYL